MLKAAVLIELSRRATGEAYGSDLERFFDQLDSGFIPLPDREEAVQRLLDEGEIDVASEGARNDHNRIFQTIPSVYHERYGITDAGFAKIAVGRRNPSTIIYKALRFGREWLIKQLEEVYGDILDSPLEALPAPAGADLDFSNNAEFQEKLLSKLDALINAVNASNELRIADNVKFETVTAALQSLHKEIQFGKTKVGRIEKIAFGSLSFLAKKFAETVIGILATDLWSLVTAFVKAVL